MALRSIHGAPRSIVHVDSYLEKPASLLVSNVTSKSLSWSVPEERRRLISSMVFQKQSLHAKASQNRSVLTTNVDASEKNSSVPMQKKNVFKSTFPRGFQTLVEEVCDHTDIAQLKLKVGDFEMVLKRDVGISTAPNSVSAPIESPLTAPPVPSTPMVETVPSPPPVVEQKSTAADSSLFTNISAAKTSKLEALEASGQNAYVLVSSPTVGSFRRGRRVKGQRLPPICKEGNIIKEGQIIGFLDQFGKDVSVRSDVSGEVLKILFKDGEPVGYGDPLLAVLPSFHGIQ